MKTVYALLFSVAFAPISQATPVMFVIRTQAGFEFGGKIHSYTDITLTATGDTANRFLRRGRWAIHHDSVQLKFDATGFVYDVLTPMYSIVTEWPVGGGNYFLLSSDCNCEVVTGPRASEFATWDILTSLGPLSGGVEFFSFAPLQTSGGPLAFDTFNLWSGSFSAEVVPEPTSVFFAAGLMIVGACCRHSGR